MLNCNMLPTSAGSIITSLSGPNLLLSMEAMASPPAPAPHTTNW